MKFWVSLVCCLVLSTLLVPSASAIGCPPQPLQFLVGTWTFSADGSALSRNLFLASAGQFTASVGTDRAGAPIGVLAITQTASVNGSPVRLEADAGRYQLNPDCTGGTLHFNVSSRPLQFEFYFVSPSEILMVATLNGDIVTGRARRTVAFTCPTNPLLALVGTWAFESRGVQWNRNFFLATVGRFEAFLGLNAAGTQIGVVRVTQSGAIGFSTVRQESDIGRFQIYPGCIGGTLTLNTSSHPAQYDFYFVDPNEIVLVNTLNGHIVAGSARRTTI